MMTTVTAIEAAIWTSVPIPLYTDFDSGGDGDGRASPVPTPLAIYKDSGCTTLGDIYGSFVEPVRPRILLRLRPKDERFCRDFVEI